MFTPLKSQTDTNVVHKSDSDVESIFKVTAILQPREDHIALLPYQPPIPTDDFTRPPSLEMRDLHVHELAQLIDHQKAFENTSTSVAASQMRNALNNLADTVTEPAMKKVRVYTVGFSLLIDLTLS